MLGKCIKKFDVLSIKEERKMLASYISQLTSLVELNLQFGYFCMHNFIWSCQKLINVDFEEFMLCTYLLVEYSNYV
jgi:hypothetical protein